MAGPRAAVSTRKMAEGEFAVKLGDQNVSGAVIGGEDSGHIIFLDQHTTGDGMLSAIRLIQTMHDEKMTLSELSQVMAVFPQVLLNIEVTRKPAIESITPVMDAIRAVEKNLGEQGRVLVRYSGTQPMCRVMVEGPNRDQTQQYCQQIADVVKTTLG